MSSKAQRRRPVALYHPLPLLFHVRSRPPCRPRPRLNSAGALAGGWGGLVVRLLPFKGAAGAVAVVAPALLGSLEGSELRDSCFAVVVRHERVNQLLRFRYHAAGVLRFHASAFHLGSELTRLELKGEHGLSRGGLRRR